jgi:single-stranded-DNA-specific exonuclease
METKWILKPSDSSPVNFGLSPIVSKLLSNRGIKSKSDILRFLNPSLSDLHDPIKMKGMDKLVQRVHNAIREGKSIAVFGDYD